jgi:hypothetical protein
MGSAALRGLSSVRLPVPPFPRLWIKGLGVLGEIRTPKLTLERQHLGLVCLPFHHEDSRAQPGDRTPSDLRVGEIRSPDRRRALLNRFRRHDSNVRLTRSKRGILPLDDVGVSVRRGLPWWSRTTAVGLRRPGARSARWEQHGTRGAVEGNRTPIAWLATTHSAFELRPRSPLRGGAAHGSRTRPFLRTGKAPSHEGLGGEHEQDPLFGGP